MIEQGSPEWLAQRCGKATASRISDIIAKTKSGYSTSRTNYAAQIICERLTGEITPLYVNQAMQDGIEREPEARNTYAFMTGADVSLAGFVDHPTIPMSGASPDGYVGDSGLIEIKSPIAATHLDTLLGQKIPEKYETQMLWQMASTGRAWCDFVSYHPAFPVHLQLFVKRFQRDDAAIKALEAEVAEFLAEIDAKIELLSQKEEAA